MSPAVICITGCVADPQFHRCCSLGAALSSSKAVNVTVESVAFYESEWENFLATKKRHLGKDMYNYEHENGAVNGITKEGGSGGGGSRHGGSSKKLRYFVVLEQRPKGGSGSASGSAVETTFIGGCEELLKFAAARASGLKQEEESLDWTAVAEQETRTSLEEGGAHNKFVYMDIQLGGGKLATRVIYELYTDLCPRTCENFRCLCTGEMGKSKDGSVRLCYRGNVIHRVVKDGWVQAGDIISGAGDAGESIYGGCFADETFAVTFDEAGVLAMAGDGSHTNASQFFVTLGPLTWMNHRAVGFGRVLSSMNIFRQMEELDLLNQRPILDCKIADCGELTVEEAASWMVQRQ